MVNNRIKSFCLETPLLRFVYLCIRKIYVCCIQWRQIVKQRQNVRKSAREIFSIIFHALEKHKYYIDYGTLLGCVREGRIIKYDLDIDFAIPPGGITPIALTTCLEQVGFSFIAGYERNGVVSEVTFGYNGATFDFFFEFVDERGVFAYTYYDFYNDTGVSGAKKAVRIYHEPVSRIKYEKMYGATIPVPENSEKIITGFYGDNWRKPDKNWTHLINDTYHTIVNDGAIKISKQRVCEIGDKMPLYLS